jgi:hypothetical protein
MDTRLNSNISNINIQEVQVWWDSTPLRRADTRITTPILKVMEVTGIQLSIRVCLVVVVEEEESSPWWHYQSRTLLATHLDPWLTKALIRLIQRTRFWIRWDSAEAVACSSTAETIEKRKQKKWRFCSFLLNHAIFFDPVKLFSVWNKNNRFVFVNNKIKRWFFVTSYFCKLFKSRQSEIWVSTETFWNPQTFLTFRETRLKLSAKFSPSFGRDQEKIMPIPVSVLVSRDFFSLSRSILGLGFW